MAPSKICTLPTLGSHSNADFAACISIWMPVGSARTDANGRAAALNLVRVTGAALFTGGASPTKSSNFTATTGLEVGVSLGNASEPLPLTEESASHSKYSKSVFVLGVPQRGESSFSNSASESTSLDDVYISLSEAVVESSPSSDFPQLLPVQNSPGIQERGTELHRRVGAVAMGTTKSSRKVFLMVMVSDASMSVVMLRATAMTEDENGKRSLVR
mmetsp:Transcript_124699/g.216091  ORF Transcript_124699/g.216091 Transcript_124699/m.216091 type:complete len:216 (+) Transcript_124699:781-1428(+)